MKMKNKIFLAIIPVMILGIILMNTAFLMFFGRYVEKQETAQIDTSANSIVDFVKEKTSKYLGTVNDWGHWDDTYEYIKGRNTGYVERNLDISSFVNLDIDFFVLMDNAQEIVYKQYYSRYDDSFGQFPEEIENELSALVTRTMQYEDVSCIQKLGTEYYFFAFSDVTDSLSAEQTCGKILIGRLIDTTTISSMEKISGCTFAGIKTSGDIAENTNPYYTRSISASGEKVEIKLVLPNAYRLTDSVQLNLDLSRDLYLSSMRNLYIFTIISLLAGLLITALIIHIWSSVLTRPFEKLVREVSGIDVTMGSISKIPVTGTIEFQHLSQSINFLINRIESVQRDLDGSRKELEATLVSVGDGVIVVDMDYHITFLNPVAQRLMGWSMEEVTGREVGEVFNIINEYTRKTVISPIDLVFERHEIVELANHTLLIAKDGTEIPIEDTAAPIIDGAGKVTGCVLVFRDSSKQKEKQKQIEYLSYHDQLTGLYNRRFFEEEFRRLDVERNFPLAIIYADVNGLKIMNDAFGHESGDKLITLVSEAMQEVCRSDDIIARIGGDEFIILLPQTDSEHAEKIIERIKAKISTLQIQGISISVSFGLDVKMGTWQLSNDVMKNAEKDMYFRKTLNINNRNQIIKAIISALFQKCREEESHSNRVGLICRRIGEAFDLSPEQIKSLGVAGEMHDIGKIFVDESILKKGNNLDQIEWIQMKKHPEVGYRLLGATIEYHAIADFVLAHHENWDGSGYPKGLKGEDILWESRAIAIAEAYERMISTQYYSVPLSKDEAIQELRKNAGAQFDPQLVDLFINEVVPRLPF